MSRPVLTFGFSPRLLWHPPEPADKLAAFPHPLVPRQCHVIAALIQRWMVMLLPSGFQTPAYLPSWDGSTRDLFLLSRDVRVSLSLDYPLLFRRTRR